MGGSGGEVGLDAMEEGVVVVVRVEGEEAMVEGVEGLDEVRFHKILNNVSRSNNKFNSTRKCLGRSSLSGWEQRLCWLEEH